MSTPPNEVPSSDEETTPKYPTENLEAMSQGILEGATDSTSGKNALVQAYKMYPWNDQDKALGIVEYYGEAIRNKLQDQKPIQNLDAALPVSLDDVVPSLPKDATDKDLYNKWEEVNNQALENNTDPKYAVNKPLLLQELKTAASQGRRDYFSQSLSESPNVREGVDISNRFLGGIAQGTGLEAISHAVSALTGNSGYDLNNWVTEHTEPTRDERLFSKITSAAGTVAGGILTFGAGNAFGYGAQAFQSGDIVASRYGQTLEKTGDPTQALKAAGIETAAQLPQALGNVKVFRGAANITQSPTLFSALARTGEAGATQAVAGGTSKLIENQAQAIQEHKNIPTFQGVGEAAGVQAFAGSFFHGAAEVNAPTRVLAPGNDPSIRQQEISESGQPTTSIKKQVVGDIPKKPASQESNTEIKPSEAPQENVDSSVVQDVLDASSVPSEAEKAIPHYTTTQGATYDTEGAGYVNGDQVSHPMDRQIFLSDSTHDDVTTAIAHGGHLYLDDAGNPVMETQELNQDTGQYEPKVTPLTDFSATPNEGLNAWSVSKERVPVKGTNLRQNSPLGKVATVYDIPLRSVGAAQAVPDALTQFSQKVLASDIIPNENKQPVGYYIAPNELTRSEASNLVAREGFNNVYNKVLTNDMQSFGGPLEQQGVIGHILDNFKAGIAQAVASGDAQKVSELNAEFGKFLALPHVQGTELAQGLQFRSTFPLEPLQRIQAAHQGAVDAYTAENLDAIKAVDADIQAKATKVAEAQSKVTDTTPPEAPQAKALETAKNELQKSTTQKEKFRTEAQARGLEAVKQQTKVEQRIQDLEKFKATTNLSKGEAAKVDDEINLLTSNNLTGPARKSWYDYWIGNQIGNGTNIIAATLTGVTAIPSRTLGLLPTSVRALFNNLTHGTLSEYHYPMLSYLKGALASKTTWSQLGNTLRTAVLEGRRYQGIAKPEEIIGSPKYRRVLPSQTEQTGVTKEGKPIPTEDIFSHRQAFSDYLKGKTGGEAFLTWAMKNPFSALGVMANGGLVEPFMRGLMAAEAVSRSLHAGGMDEAARDFYYNKALRENDTTTLNQLKYDRASLWKQSQARAALNAEGLRSLGFDVSKGEEHIHALESYYGELPRQVMVDAQKKSAEMAYNGPAAGIAGHVSRFVQLGADLVDLPLVGKTPAKILTAFSNAGAHATNLMLENTPLSLASAYFPSGPKSPMERSMLLGSGLVSLGLIGGLAVKALANLDTPEDQRYFDIIGRYSSDPKKVAAFTANGGQQYSLRFGNKYIHYKDTPYGMGLAAAASIVDMKRDGKLTDDKLNSAAGISTALGMASLSMLTAPAQLSFMRTLGSIFDGISKASQASNQGNDTAAAAIVNEVGKYMIGVGKGFIPGAGIFRTISHYTDNPVEARKDIQSVLTQNIPYLQTHGIPGVSKPLPALNVLGEKLDMTGHTGLPAIHRLFSTRADDADIRWLTDNGYTVPDPYQVMTKKNKTLKGLGFEDGLTVRQQHALAMAAAPANRQIVGQFREALGSSAFSKRTQQHLNKAIRRNYANAATRLGYPALEASQNEGEIEREEDSN